MKYFFDFEFIEDGKTIDPISLGLVCEDGRELYFVFEECDWSKANDWVVENVLTPMGLSRTGWIVTPDLMSACQKQHYLSAEPTCFIKWKILDFIKGLDFGDTSLLTYEYLKDYEIEDEALKPEFWAYYGDYDWVCFCQLFGRMIDLPSGFPMYCNDIKQECKRLGDPALPKQLIGNHDALQDARHNQVMWNFLQSLKGGT